MSISMNDKNVKFDVYMKENGEEVSFSFRTSLSASEKVDFVNSVTDILVGDNYNYIIRDLIFDFYLVNMLTDIDMSDIEDIEDPYDLIDKIDELVNKTTVVDIVKLNLDNEIIEELENAVAFNIEYRTGIHNNPVITSLGNLINTIEKKVKDYDFASMMDIAEAMSGISGEFTPEKIIDAYAKTNIFKENWENGDKSSAQVKADNTPVLSPAFEV